MHGSDGRRIAPHQEILDLIRAMPVVDVQNRLLRIRDGDLALSMLYMVEMQRNLVISLAGSAKGSRVREALARLEHTRIRYDQYEQTAREVIRALKGATAAHTNAGSYSGAESRAGTGTGASTRQGSYFRPTRRNPASYR